MISVPLASLVLGLEEGALSSKGNSYLAFRKIRKGKRTLPVFVDSQLPSAQNNPYAKVACFGVKYFATLKQTFVVLPYVMVIRA